jgi:cytochrome c
MKTLKITLALAAGIALALPLMADVSPTAAAPAAKPKSSAPDPAGAALIKKSDCLTCHSVTKKVIGPAYKDVAKNYKGVAGAEEMLVQKAKNGGSGHWGAGPMSGHPSIPDSTPWSSGSWPRGNPSGAKKFRI